MRINSFLAKAGLGSRRSVEELINSGDVQINGKVAKLSDKVEDADIVTFKGKEIAPKSKRYFLLYKPVGYISTTEDPHAKNKVVDLVPVEGVFPVGRLDKESEGLMILTNDGDLALQLTHPRYAHEKEYLVKVKVPSKNGSQLLENAIKFFKCGVLLDGKKTQSAQIKLISQEGSIATFNVVLKEGMKRQIRRTFEKAHLEVLSLKRIRISQFNLGSLKKGEYKEITVNKLRNI